MSGGTVGASGVNPDVKADELVLAQIVPLAVTPIFAEAMMGVRQRGIPQAPFGRQERQQCLSKSV